jgi:hypothetical protein
LIFLSTSLFGLTALLISLAARPASTATEAAVPSPGIVLSAPDATSPPAPN